MALETRRAEQGVYGPDGTYTWTASGTRPVPDLAPGFTPGRATPTSSSSSQMDYTVVIANTGITYLLTVTDPDPNMANAPVLTATQTGAVTLDTTYNK
jgi:hypothetical protein